MDSMTKEELDGIKPLDEKRIKRVSRGSGVHIAEIHFLMAEHKKFGAMVKQVGGMTGMMGNMENVSKIVV
jgi:signal recognition particle subunit SRP54